MQTRFLHMAICAALTLTSGAALADPDQGKHQAPAEQVQVGASEASAFTVGESTESWHGVYSWSAPAEIKIPMQIQVEMGDAGSELSINGKSMLTGGAFKEGSVIRLTSEKDPEGKMLQYTLLPDGNLKQIGGEEQVYIKVR